jgi:hypothetical protein
MYEAYQFKAVDLFPVVRAHFQSHLNTFTSTCFVGVALNALE